MSLPQGIRHSVAVTEQNEASDIESDEVTEVLLYVAAFLGLLLVIAVAAAIACGLRALRHW